ncbi:hypothetical protein [Salinarimonas soli]|uniref:Tail fiber domain-containing protein n=1 Tax=Salinarimonas soli TaxID=1638099 RepID=A0A5B2VSC7_9HYPH|nr:hypothetical protein [Salinarimonas soli]KAA2241152.1 hypothetical protein F0L46_04970 [Salinarimonas soli]
MGLFDVFSSKKQRDRLQSAANIGTDYINAGRDAFRGDLTAGLDRARSQYGQAGSTLQALGDRYLPGANLYMDSLGVNGAAGNQRAVGAFQAGPGYQWAMEQSQDQLDRRQAARGQLGSGNTSADSVKLAQGLANQEYGGWQNRLQGLDDRLYGARTGQAGLLASLGNLEYQGGRDLGQNSFNALSSIGQLHSNTQAQQAQASQQASQNIFGAAMGLGQLGLSALGSGLGSGFFGGASTLSSLGDSRTLSPAAFAQRAFGSPIY